MERSDIDLIDIASPNDTHAEIAIAAAQAGKIVMCEKPLGRNCRGSRGNGGRRGIGQGSKHGLVQLPPRARSDAAKTTDRRRATWDASFTIARSFFRTGPFRKICRKAAKGCGGWM